MIRQLLSSLVYFVPIAAAKSVRSPTPPRGWNSYNNYGCNPNEEIIKSNAQGLINLGLANLGYTQVIVDCGWPARGRDSQGRLQWNQTLFPSGPNALGDYIHGLGLKFGVYSGAGYYQCGSSDLPASKGYEEIDAASFAEWGGDVLKYDNCYSDSTTNMVNNTSQESMSPDRFQKMAKALDAADRDIGYYVCQWGIGYDVGAWASTIGNTWRISNDIYNAWRSIWRITNEAVPYWRYTAPGAFPDMDMLIIGLGALSYEEERFHFGMWAINKSPLILGAKMDASSFPMESLSIVEDKEVMAINQDPLGKQAQLIRRYTEEQWDIWVGVLSESRMVVGIANWKNNSQIVQVNLSNLGIASANARDVWAKEDLGSVSGVQMVNLLGHELRLWVLSTLVPSTPLQSSVYYSTTQATLSGSAKLNSCGTNTCLPIGQKVKNIGSGAKVTFKSVSAASAGSKVLSVDFINYDIATDTAWEWGDNARNMTIAVNGGTAKRWDFPISGGDWSESASLMIEVPGFIQGGSNQVVFSSFGTAWAPDLVGFKLLE